MVNYCDYLNCSWSVFPHWESKDKTDPELKYGGRGLNMCSFLILIVSRPIYVYLLGVLLFLLFAYWTSIPPFHGPAWILPFFFNYQIVLISFPLCFKAFSFTMTTCLLWVYSLRHWVYKYPVSLRERHVVELKGNSMHINSINYVRCHKYMC